MNPPPSLPFSPLVVRREDMRAREDAASIVARAERDAGVMLQEARQVALADRQRGYAEGAEEGHAQTARLLAEAAATVDGFYEAREQEITELAFAIAHRILGDFPVDEQMARLARAAIAEHRGASHLVLRVSPADAPALQQGLATGDDDTRVEIQVDETAPPGSCVLVHPRGRTSVGLLDQFRALMAEMGGA